MRSAYGLIRPIEPIRHMKFSQLATYFEQMEATSKRNELVQILADLFKKSDPEEIGQICYFVQGRIVPFYEPLEIGMAEKTIALAIAKAYDNEKKHVLDLYRKLGDLGLVAEKLHKGPHFAKTSRGRKDGDLSVNDVHAALINIAKTAGTGSQEKKLHAFCDLLSTVDATSAKHVCRIPLGRSRLGVGDPTVLDALSFAKTGDKSLRKPLEAGYNKTSDLGHVAKTFWKHGIKAVEKLDVEVGKPIRSELTERIPNPEKVIEKLGPVNVQPKYDGFRVAIHMDRHKNIGLMNSNGNLEETKVKLFSRNLEDMTHMFPELRKAALDEVKADAVILDSEALAYNPDSDEFYPFQETTKRRRKHGIEETAKVLPLRAFVFDVMYVNGKSVMEQPQSERMALLKKLIPETGTLQLTPGELVDNPKRLIELFDDAISKGLEGLVVKRPDSPYEAGARNFNWVKVKRQASGDLADTVDCVILGYIAGRGKRAQFGAGALLVGVYNEEKDEFETITKIGTGLSDAEWQEIHKRADKIQVSHKPARVNAILEPTVWVTPKIVIEVFADEITRSPTHTAGKTDTELGYALRFPRLLKFREGDKKAEEATTVEEIKRMYTQQYNHKKS